MRPTGSTDINKINSDKPKDASLKSIKHNNFKQFNGLTGMDTLFTVAKCKTKATYSAKLQKPQTLNLKSIQKQFDIILETPILLVIKVDHIEIIVHSYGELLFKSGEDMNWMEKTAKKIYEVGLKK